MANLYSVPLKNSIQHTLAATLTISETGTITLDSAVDLELQATASMKGILVIDRVDVNGVATPLKTEYIAYTGVSGSTVTGLTRGLAGTSAQGHSIGSIVEFVPDVTWAQAINDVFTTQHNSDGTHKPFSGVSLASSSIVTSNIDTFSFKNINAPEGFLINGKIVPSVASNNLTVALKTLAGNDPSASDPIYVRIGDTIRTISSALSVTLNAGTNWFNSGSSKLATKEVDYFVYLSYEDDSTATRIGFSRIPYAGLYSDFSATTTNEKHGAFDDAPDATNSVVNIGRFAATLSATASFNWSVPTFNSNNLIQRPIFESRWLDLTGSTNITLGNGTLIQKYKVLGNDFKCYAYFQFGTTSSFSGGVRLESPFVTRTNGFQGNSTNLLMQVAGTIYQGQVLTDFNANNNFELYINNSSTAINGTQPGTWANGSRFSFLITIPFVAVEI